MKKFEYKKVKLDEVKIDMTEMNELGKQGWELIHLFDNNLGLFKRELLSYTASNTDNRDLLQESYENQD